MRRLILKYWCVPLGEQRVETEGASKSEDIEINPKADYHPGNNQAQSCLTSVLR